MVVQYHQGRFPPGNLDWPRLLPSNRMCVVDHGMRISDPQTGLW